MWKSLSNVGNVILNKDSSRTDDKAGTARALSDKLSLCTDKVNSVPQSIENSEKED